MKKSIILVMLVASLQVGYGQEVCECGSDRPDAVAPAGIMTDHIHPKNKWMLSYRYNSEFSGKTVNGSQIISDNDIYKNYLNSPQSMRMDMHMLMFMYGLTSRITIMGMSQYMNNTMHMNMYAETGVHHHDATETENNEMHMGSRGWGDSKLTLLYQLYKNCDRTLVVSTGVGAPTGSISTVGRGLMSYQKIQNYAMQTGSGSWEVSPGIIYKSLLTKSSWGINLNARIILNQNNQGYRTGHELNSSIWYQHLLAEKLSLSFRNEFLWKGQMQGSDLRIYWFSDPGSHPHNSGGLLWRTPVGMNFKAGKSFLQLEGAPVIYFKGNGIQQKPVMLLNFAWHYKI